MRYLQSYKNKKVIGNYIEVNSQKNTVFLRIDSEAILYDCFSTPTTLQEAYQRTYNNDMTYMEFFNDRIATWYKAGILIGI